MSVRVYNACEYKADLYGRVSSNNELMILICDTTWGDIPMSLWGWDSASTAGDDFTNGVVLPTGYVGTGRWIRRGWYNVQSDWGQASSSVQSFIQNKTSYAAVATSGSYNDLSNKPTIPAAQVNSDWNAGTGAAQILNKPTIPAIPGTSNAAGYGTGTAYTLTTSSAKITQGTTSPTITIPAAGTYLIISNVTIDYSGLTTLAVAAANFKIRRTNNTAADIANTSTNFNVPIVTLLTQTGGDADINAVIYTTANNNDVLELWGSRGAVTVGNIQITNGYIVAVKLY